MLEFRKSIERGTEPFLGGPKGAFFFNYAVSI